MKLLKKYDNILNKIDKPVCKKVKIFIRDPTFDNWDSIRNITLINSAKKPHTLWWIVLSANPVFVRQKRIRKVKDSFIKDWEIIPTPL
jgi:hypothetical protein